MSISDWLPLTIVFVFSHAFGSGNSVSNAHANVILIVFAITEKWKILRLRDFSTRTLFTFKRLRATLNSKMFHKVASSFIFDKDFLFLGAKILAIRHFHEHDYMHISLIFIFLHTFFQRKLIRKNAKILNWTNL